MLNAFCKQTQHAYDETSGQGLQRKSANDSNIMSIIFPLNLILICMYNHIHLEIVIIEYFVFQNVHPPIAQPHELRERLGLCVRCAAPVAALHLCPPCQYLPLFKRD